MAYLFQKSIYIIPRYSRKKNSDPEFKKDSGYLTVDGVVRESDSAFSERMCGLISFYSAVIQTNSLSGKLAVVNAF